LEAIEKGHQMPKSKRRVRSAEDAAPVGATPLGEILTRLLPEVVITCDSEGAIESLNPAARALFGRAESELLGQDIRRLLPDLEPSRLFSGSAGDAGTADDCRPSCNIERFALQAIDKDGAAFPVEVASSKWRAGSQERLVVVLWDLRERRQDDWTSRESEIRFRQLADQVEEGFVVRDRDEGRIIYANSAYEAVLGSSVTSRNGADPLGLDFVHPDDRKRVLDIYENLMDGEGANEEYRICRPDADVRWVRTRAFPMADPDGSVHRDVYILHDITHKRALEDELSQARALGVVGSLVSGVAHDFNNTLHAVLGCVNMARKPGITPARARAFLDRAATAIQRGGELATQLTTFARQHPRKPRPLRIDPLVRSLAKLIERLVTSQISVQLHTNAGDRRVLADPIQIERILMNLAANARDAMPHGGVLSIGTEVLEPSHPAVKRLELAEASCYIRLVVQDSGIGMDEATRQRAFEPFFTTKASTQGTGLGLSTVFAMTRELGGNIAIESDLTSGTRFEILLPCSDLEVETPPSGVLAIGSFEGRALLVEADPLVRKTVSIDLRELGFDVFTAGTPDAATELMRSHGPMCVLVVDALLPKMRGPELARHLASVHPIPNVLYMSANPDFLGPDEVDPSSPILRKPFDKSDLARALAEQLASDVALGEQLALDLAPAEQLASDVAPAPRPRASSLQVKDVAAPRCDRSAQPCVLIVDDNLSSCLALAELLEDRDYATVIATTAPQALEMTALLPGMVDILLIDVDLPGLSGTALAERLCSQDPRLCVVYMAGLPNPTGIRSLYVQKPVAIEKLVRVLDDALKSRRSTA
jgi:PAS domain S-box-containing protein